MCESLMWCVLCTTARVQSVETSFLFLGTIKNESESLILLLTIPIDSLWGSGQASLLTNQAITPWSLNKLFVPLAVWAGAKSCWKMKSTSP